MLTEGKPELEKILRGKTLAVKKNTRSNKEEK